VTTVFVDPPSPPGFVAFRHSHGGFGECCKTSRLKFPTLDVFHAASLLLERGFPSAVVDSVLEDHSPQECVRAVLARKPSAVVFRTASGSLPHDARTARLLRRRFGGPVVFFGPQAAVEARRLLASGTADAVVGGTSPFVFLEAVRRGRWAGTPGVSTLASGRVVSGGRAPEPDLDALPVPRWDLVDHRRYTYVTSQTTWGCPFGCGYCPYPVTQGARWRARSVEKVVAEFAALRERYALRFVLLRDPEFTLERRRTERLCRALIDAGTPLLWGCETRLETLDEPLIALMARAGCIRVAFGVDSVNPGTLAAMGRKAATPAALARKVRALKRSGILTYGMYIVGLPGETRASVKRLVDFAVSLDTNAASFGMATPFPGTRLESAARAAGLVEAADPEHLTSCVPSMRTESLSLEEVETLYLAAKAKWNSHLAGRKAAASARFARR
jgi:radical SAM superfamily enzyme YgiQ (UPF0313 family)